MSFFIADQLRTGYGGKPVLDGVSFSCEAGTILGVLGENACGKTTLFKSISGILPHSGSCVLKGQKLEGLSARSMSRLCSYIPQRSGISIDISALDVILMGFNPHLRILEQPSSQMVSHAAETLAAVGLAGLEQENYLRLSEGQKQLCILARTLVSATSLLLLDEPESALDFLHRHKMLQILRSWIDESERSAIISLHDPLLALNSCDRILLLHGGRIAAEINPKSDALAEMEEKLSLIYGSLSLHKIKNKSGSSRFAMIIEEDDACSL